MFCPILKDECNPECVLMTDQSCCIRKLAYICEDTDKLKANSNKQDLRLESLDAKVNELNQTHDEILKLLRAIKGL